MRPGAVVSLSYRASRFDGGIRWVEEVIAYVNRACILHGHCFHDPILRPGGGHKHEQGDDRQRAKSSRRFMAFLL